MKTISFTKAVFLFALGIFLTTNKLSAQENRTTASTDYDNAIGIRFGGTSGITFKHKFSPQNSMELILGTYPHTFGITGLYERYFPTTVDGFNLYAGAGAHIARSYYRTRVFYYDYNDDRYYSYRAEYGPIIGLDAIGGMEYKFERAPVALSMDVKPNMEFYRGFGPYLRLDPGLGVKFTF
ncbi:MAG: hypothetical protein K0S32_3840 [Bacteroidetes bacterium]|jgi:hypothetical protein|nr:hypothetical protein [Bacteroidota bacterium]